MDSFSLSITVLFMFIAASAMLFARWDAVIVYKKSDHF
jgi:hypothetical protein